MVMHPLYLYFYIQSFKFNLPNDWYRENMTEAAKVLKLIEDTYQMNYKDVYFYIKNSNAYGMIRSACEKGVGNFIEQETLSDFLRKCNNLI